MPVVLVQCRPGRVVYPESRRVDWEALILPCASLTRSATGVGTSVTRTLPDIE
jgi:hypothetical protein